MDERTAGGHLLDLPAEECWALAAGRPVGRFAWSTPNGPTVIPVNFTVEGTQVHIRTGPYTALARECDDSIVAFEVDDIDEPTRTGWSVLMRGRAHLHFDGDEPPEDPDVWAPGTRSLRVSVEVHEVSGRRLQRAD